MWYNGSETVIICWLRRSRWKRTNVLFEGAAKGGHARARAADRNPTQKAEPTAEQGKGEKNKEKSLSKVLTNTIKCDKIKLRTL